ncbi:MAG: 7-carboxy-7-deazaguanine synthase QueE [Elusimicrobia bacterium]|nr:7-carboxy-7-deazaguanine synthase QueE [Elusimicrobiota bacterium]
MKTLKAKITEIFTSIQGEGLYAGQKQVFVRFAGCELGCSYCDEPAALVKRSTAPFYRHQSPVTSHQQYKESGDNGSDYREMSAAAATEEVIKLARKNRAKAVSLTGGEPLLNWEFIKVMAPALKDAGLAVHFETNGILYRELDKVKDLADVIAMDIKPPSSTGGKAFWREHSMFIKAAPKKTFVKVVVTSGTSVVDFGKAVNVAARACKAVPFFIQPAAPKGGVRPPSREKLDVFYKLAAARLEDVRILPQLHKLWGVK